MKLAVRIVALTLLYVIVAKLGLLLSVSRPVLIWAPAGLALVMVALEGPVAWPALVLGAVIETLSAGGSWGFAAATGMAAPMGPTLAWALMRRFGFRPALERVQDVLSLIGFGALLGPATSAGVGLTGWMVMGGGDWGAFWLRWWSGEMLGVLIVAPALFVWLSPARASQRRTTVEMALLAGAVLVVTGMAFGGWGDGEGPNLPATYLTFTLVVWGALRFGHRGGTLVTLVIVMIAVAGTARGLGPFAGGPAGQSLWWAWTYATTLGVTALMLAALVVERVQEIQHRRRQDRVLRDVAGGHELGDVIGRLLEAVEDQIPGATGTVLARQTDGWRAATPGPLTDFVLRTHERFGEHGTPWGDAVRSRRRVTLVTDGSLEFSACARYLREHGYAGCWTFPITAVEGANPVGALVVLARGAAEPSEREEHLVQSISRFCGLVFERAEASASLRRTSEALEAATAQFSALVDHAGHVAIQGYDREGRVVFWNRASEALYGFPRSVVTDQGLDVVFADSEVAERFRGVIARVIDSGEVPAAEEWEKTTADGRVLMVLSSVFPIPSKDGPDWAISMDVDSTERHRLERQLVESQRMEAVGTLAGGIAHDFNNLTTAILGYADLLGDALPEADAAARGQLESIRKAANQAGELTNQLLAFARKRIVDPRTILLNDLIVGIDPMFRRVMGEDIDVVTLAGPDLWPVRIDPGDAEQVLLNLALNAKHAMPNGGKLTVEAANYTVTAAVPTPLGDVPPGEYVRLSVADTGVGMDEATIRRIFEPFFTTKALGVGTGLGLATSYGIVRQSGGYIMVSSVPGEGARFDILLPRCGGEPSGVSMAAAAAAAPGGTETILVVDDEPLIRELVRETLEKLGYRVLVAGNGEDALSVARTHTGTIDLLVADVIMPYMNGVEVCRELRSDGRVDQVLFMSGHAEDFIVEHGVTPDTVDFIQKPFLPVVLAGRVRDVLDGSRV